ncbi:MAG: AAA family ATPase [Lachnospiraceae bacterium]|nr:AAA family ATPase [Lachnospiraceae bacterium]
MAEYEFSPFDARRFADFLKIPVKERNNELIFRKCPYCGETSNDKFKFSINLSRGVFHCFRAKCGVKGNMLTLAKDFNFDLGVFSDSRNKAIQQYRNIDSGVKPISKQPAIDYMKGRGISEEITRKYNITIQNENPDALVFPFYDDNNKLQFIKYRLMHYDKNINSYKEWSEKGCKSILFGMNHCNSDIPTLVLTEGQIDSLSLAEAGVNNPVSVGTGAGGFTWVSNCYEFLGKYKTIIVFGDNEDGHITLVDELSRRYDGQIKQIRQEDYLGCKDANEILVKYGKEALRKAVANAEPIKHPNILSLSDVKRVDMNKLEHIFTGITSLDWLIGGLYLGQLIVLTGERGHGKSTLASLFISRAVEQGYNVFAYSGELLNWYFKGWIESQMAGKHINKIKSENGKITYSVDANCIPYIEKWYQDKIYIYDKHIVKNDEEVPTILETIETAIKQYDCKLVVVDNLMTAMVDDISSDQYRQQTNFVNNLVNLAKRYNVIVLLVAHPRKQQGTLFQNDDIAGSANITNLADVVLRYNKADDPSDRMENERILTVLKNRLTGKLCTNGIKLYFDEGSKRISDTKESFGWELGWEKEFTENRKVVDYGDLPFY